MQHYTQDTLAIQKQVDEFNRQSRKLRVQDIPQAQKSAENAYKLAKSIDYKKGMGMAMLNQSFQDFYVKGDITSTYKKINEATELLTASGSKEGLNWAATIQGSMYVQQGEYEKAFATFRKALIIADELQDKESEMLAGYLLGNLYLDLKDYDNALSLHLKMFEIAQALQDILAIGNGLVSIANSYHAKGEFEKAIAYLEESIEVTKNDKRATSHARALHDLGAVYETLGQYSKAIELIELSLAERTEFGNKQGVITCYLSLGRLYARMQDFDYGISLLKKAIELAMPLNTKPKIMRAYQEMATIYKEIEKPWEALASYEKYMEYKSEVMGEETSSQLRNAAAIYAAEQAQKEAEIEKLRNTELKEAYHKIETQNQHIIDSIKYAKRIQEAILDPVETITKQLGNAFIFYHAKDIVSGDFYWYGEVESDDTPDKVYKVIIAADCTGHGVPGAFMTVMGNDFLNDIVIGQQIINPAMILYRLDEKVTTTLQKQGRENSRTNDGMDISVLVIDEKEQKAKFAAAKHPLYVVRNGEITEIKGSKFPIGSSQYNMPKKFEVQSYDLQKNDLFYLCSDGYQDQFGENNKGKFMKRRFRELLLIISHLPLQEQQDILQKTILEWKGKAAQTDDWLVMGIKF
jgi:serine phosphatase RsbU (regulator of sigma subunit)